LLSYYNDSPSKLIKAVYPDLNLEKSTVEQWKDATYQRVICPIICLLILGICGEAWEGAGNNKV
jgi:hypothetical protein